MSVMIQHCRLVENCDIECARTSRFCRVVQSVSLIEFSVRGCLRCIASKRLILLSQKSFNYVIYSILRYIHRLKGYLDYMLSSKTQPLLSKHGKHRRCVRSDKPEQKNIQQMLGDMLLTHKNEKCEIEIKINKKMIQRVLVVFEWRQEYINKEGVIRPLFNCTEFTH